jgi:hypothetical protein
MEGKRGREPFQPIDLRKGFRALYFFATAKPTHHPMPSVSRLGGLALGKILTAL